MKKAYLAAAFTGLMCVSILPAGCGREPEEKDDEEEFVYVEEIDEDDLEDQIEVLTDHIDDWQIDTDAEEDIRSTSYCVADLDHNGRVEILTFTGYDSSYSVSEIHVYEVDEKGRGLEEAKWKTAGLDMGDGYPDPGEPFTAYRYYDEDEETEHYLLCDLYYPEGENGGMIFCDVSYSNGKVKCNNYAAMMIADDYTPEYITDDDAEIEDDLDFSEYLKEYGGEQEDVAFGLYIREGSAVDEIGDLDDDELAAMLTDSYLVFADDYDVDDFDEEYNPDTAGGAGVVSDEGIYEKILGDWYISHADLEGQEMQFDKDSGAFMILSFLEDMALVTEYADGEQTMRISAGIEFDDDGTPYFVYDDPSGLTEQIDYEIYTVTDLSGDEEELTVSLDFYDDDIGRLGGYTLYFTR